MKKILLIFAIFTASISYSQTVEPIWVDTFISGNDSIIHEYYHMKYDDGEGLRYQNDTVTVNNPRLTSKVGKIIRYRIHSSGVFFVSRPEIYQYYLETGQSITNPNNPAQSFTYDFVKNYIYDNGRSWIFTLSEWQIRNDVKRFER